MASKKTIIKSIAVIKTIYSYFGKDVDLDLLVDTWTALLSNYTDEEVDRGLFLAMRVCKYAPVPADIIEQIENYRQIENTHIRENIIYNELRYRNFNVDVGVVECRETTDGKSERKQLEIDFVANKGNQRYYIQSAYDIPNEQKMQQETKSFNKIDDSFKKIIVCEKNIRPRRNEKGYLIIGIREFLLNPNSLEL